MSDPSEHAAALGRRGLESLWSGTTPEQRRAQTAPARIALAVKTIVDQAPALTEDQKNRQRAILAQTPPGGPGA